MSAPQLQLRVITLALVLAYPALTFAADTEIAQASPPARPATAATVASTDTQQLPAVEIVGTRKRLDAARNGLSPDTGSSIYRFDRQDIQNLPMGEDTPLNQLVLQSPGVVQDSYGQLHVRGDHANIQYRINGVVIPESISGFGQSLQTRFAEKLTILTGALPAQYGYRTAAVVDIQSKGESPENGGNLSVTLGSHGHVETALELSGTHDALSYYLTGAYLGSNIGIENPTPDATALHDKTHQTKGFGYFSYLLGADSRVNLMLGSTNNRFQIPNVPGQTAQFMLDGAPPANSATLDAHQQEQNRFAVLSYQGAAGQDVDYQVAMFRRNTDVHYQPDVAGDLQYKGIAADILRSNIATGLQADLSYTLNASHTLRSGLFAQAETYTVSNSAQVFNTDANGNPLNGIPVTIADNTGIAGHLWGAYLQDEWKLGKALTLNYGLRYDQANTVVNESQLSPRLGLVYKAGEQLQLHAGYARYFTPPPTEKIDTTSVQKFLGTSNALPSDANTAVKSERSNYFDLGAVFQATPKLSLSLDGYYREISHLQDEGQFGNALIYSAYNYAKGRIYGLDFAANFRDKSFSSYLNIGFTHARGTQVETGQFNFGAPELAYIADHWVHLDHEQSLSASAGAALRLDNGVSLSADALYGSGLRNGYANTDHLPAYLTVNAAVAKSFNGGAGLGKWDARLSVVNLFDHSYALRDGSGIGVGAPQFGLRRTLYASLSKPF